MNTAFSTLSNTTSSHSDPRIRPLLTPREQEVLYLIAYEYSTREIAKKLYVSYETINSHRKNIMAKMGVKNTAGMIRVAFELNILK